MKRILSLLLAIAMLCALLPAAGVSAANDFTDVPQNAWFADAVNYAVRNGLMNGVGNGRFDPNGSMTRAMLVTVLWRYEGSPEEGVNGFTDVPDGQWFTKAVAWAAENGIVGGIGGGKFDPNGNVTREQMAAILFRYADQKDIDTSERATLNFPDAAKVSAWATDAIAWTVAEGIIGGSDGMLLPQGNATRAQVSTILMRFIEDVAKDPVDNTLRVALVTDIGNVDDESYNQAVYEAGKAWCAAHNVAFTYYQPKSDSTDARVSMVKKAVQDGYNVILMPGYLFGETIISVQNQYPNVRFVGLDVSSGDLTYDYETYYQPAANTVCITYKEEQAGYLAGYAAVKMGYEKLGFLGGMAVPAVVRYGYGFVQGVNAAAVELGKTKSVSVKYVYGGQFFGDAVITAYMDDWFASGTEVVFACGGGIYTSAVEAAAKVGGKVIGVDVDQAPIIDSYADGLTVTSAMKNLGQSVRYILNELNKGNWSAHGGREETLGIISADPSQNYVCLPDSTQWNAGFTKDDYAALVGRLSRGELTVSANIDGAPPVSISVDYQGTIPSHWYW